MITSVVEFAGDNVSYFNPDEPENLVFQLQELLSHNRIAPAITQEELVRSFSWTRSAERLANELIDAVPAN